jgi:hypothetical protein
LCVATQAPNTEVVSTAPHATGTLPPQQTTSVSLAPITSTALQPTIIIRTPQPASSDNSNQSQHTFPDEYSNPDALAKWIPHYSLENKGPRRTPNYSGFSKEKILKIWPAFKNLILGQKRSAYDRLSMREQGLIRQGDVAAKHVGQGTDNVFTVLGQFLHFMKDHKEDNLLKEGSYDVLAAYPRIYAFLKFLQMWGYRSSTVRNKAAILKGCLKHIQHLAAFVPGSILHTRLVTAMNTCEKWRSNMKTLTISERSKEKNEDRLIAEGKFFKPPEDTAFFRWLIQKIHQHMTKNVKKINVSDTQQTSLWTLKILAECQPYWITLVHMCLGGQRLQVTAGIKMDSLKWTTSGEEIILQTEKTARKNMEGIPVPQALQMYLTYWTKYVVTACRKRDTIQSIWLSSLGEPLEYKEVSKSIKKVAQIFNPDLTVTAIEFRRMAITNFFKESQEFIQSNTKNLADWLNVSEEVMRQHYNRASAHNTGTRNCNCGVTKEQLGNRSTSAPS